MIGESIYLDNNATTPCAPEVIEEMLPYFSRKCGNPASPHNLGRQAALAVTRARECIAQCIDCEPGNIYFTSGATEANNMAILGLMGELQRRRKLVLSDIEHKSVSEPATYLSKHGIQIQNISVLPSGLIDLVEAARVIDDETALVCVQAANNEIGTIQPVREVARIAHEHGAVVHCDGAQLGKLPFSFLELDVDSASFSAHKAYGPKGVGFLVTRRSTRSLGMDPIMFGRWAGARHEARNAQCAGHNWSGSMLQFL